MRIQRLVLFAGLLSSELSVGQKIGDYYVAISPDGTLNRRIKLLSDSTMELSSKQRHMSVGFKKTLHYTSTDTTINFSWQNTSQQIILAKTNRVFIDHHDSVIYVREKDFKKNRDLAYIIDGKKYFQDRGVTDGYGLIKRKPKKNRRLNKQLDMIGKNADEYSIEIIRGLNAYQRFGIETVFGAIVITKKT